MNHANYYSIVQCCRLIANLRPQLAPFGSTGAKRDKYPGRGYPFISLKACLFYTMLNSFLKFKFSNDNVCINVGLLLFSHCHSLY